jgi:hypothetical protein
VDDVVAIIAFFGTVIVFVVTLANLITRWREISQQSQVMTRLVDSVGSGEDAVTLMESPTLRSFVDRAMDRRTVVLGRVIRSVQVGIVLVVTGGALFGLRSTVAGAGGADAEAYTGFTVLGTLALALGVAFFLAAGASYWLSSRWKLIEGPDRTD